MAVTDTHEEKETLVVDVLLPRARGTHHHAAVPAFQEGAHRARGRSLLHLRRDGGREGPSARSPPPSHRALAGQHDRLGQRGHLRSRRALGPYAAAFDWDDFDPADPYTLVDDMTVNGLLLCKVHHTGEDEGIHDMPFPLWIAQKYAREGYQFTPTEVIHHADS